MSSIVLFDSCVKSRKSRPFGRGVLRYVPSSRPAFEPSSQDREWWARQQDDPQVGPEYHAWLDRLECERRMEDAYAGCEFAPKSTPISDADIDAVNVAG
jgi:hypothetical protein